MNILEKTAAKQRLTNRLKEKLAGGFLNRMKQGAKTLFNLKTVGQRMRDQVKAVTAPTQPTPKAPKPPKVTPAQTMPKSTF